MIACGSLTVPDIKEAWDSDKPADAAKGEAKIPGAAQIEFEIKKRIYCDLKEAVQEVNRYPVTSGSYNKQVVKQEGLLPFDWGAQVSLSLQVDEVSALNPGITLNDYMPNAIKIFNAKDTVTVPQSFTLGFGGTLSSTATRIDKFDPYYSIAFLMVPDTHTSVCRPENDPFVRQGWIPASSSPFILESDLGIKDWLLGAMIVDNLLPSVGAPPKGGGKDTVTYEIKFVIVSSGNVTPTWKLVRVSANTGALPFFNAGRTRTHDLIITIGPSEGARAQQASQTHLASQIGNAVSNANRALLATP